MLYAISLRGDIVQWQSRHSTTRCGTIEFLRLGADPGGGVHVYSVLRQYSCRCGMISNIRILTDQCKCPEIWHQRGVQRNRCAQNAGYTMARCSRNGVVSGHPSSGRDSVFVLGWRLLRLPGRTSPWSPWPIWSVSLNVFARIGVKTYHSDSQAAWLDPLDYFVNLVCVDAETVECTGRGELHMGLGGEVCRMTSAIH